MGNDTGNKILAHALDLAEKGFYIFPIMPGEKSPPAMEGWQDEATRDLEKIKSWWRQNSRFNIGISTSKFNGEGEALLAVDVDNKGSKDGSGEIVKLELQGFEFSETFTQITPTGGKHLIYKVKDAVKQGVDKLGVGLDIRSKGGYLVGSGSLIGGKAYTQIDHEVIEAPFWIITKCGKAREKSKAPATPKNIDHARAIARAIHYLENEAPLAIEGAHGDQTTFRVAATVKDLGVPFEDTVTLLEWHWNERCTPPWNADELETKVRNAFNHGSEFPGSLAPETQFEPIEVLPDKVAPVQEINKEFAYVVAGGGDHILWETKNSRGAKKLEHLNIQAFQRKMKPKVVINADGKMQEISNVWMKSKNRRSYDGIVFMPGQEAPPQFYNLWQGFSVEPYPPTEKPSDKVEKAFVMYIEHVSQNICGGNEKYFNWVMSYLAHLIQKPWEKPGVALVLRGEKGVGKNIFIEPVGRILGSSYLLTSNARYLSSNFNGHLENLLLFTLDEAFWSGDKRMEGTLKDLITGQTHVIERKGSEAYTVDNCLRLVIFGNEQWLVPASQDERRFAVFQVAPHRKQDTKYFTQINSGMRAGGDRLLLEYLKNYDISQFNPNQAPKTKALMEQKHSSLDVFFQWWHECLTEGVIKGLEFSEAWPTDISRDQFRDAFTSYWTHRRIKGRTPDSRMLGRMFKQVSPSTVTGRKRNGHGVAYGYVLPELAKARAEWDEFIGHEGEWDT